MVTSTSSSIRGSHGIRLGRCGDRVLWGDRYETECCGGETDARQSVVAGRQMRDRVLWWGGRCETWRQMRDREIDVRQCVKRHLGRCGGCGQRRSSRTVITRFQPSTLNPEAYTLNPEP